MVEQDHRAIKQRCAPMLGLKSFRSAAITLAGIELAHRIRKQQYSAHSGANGRTRSLKDSWTAALAGSAALQGPGGERCSPMHQNSEIGLEWPRERPRIDGQVRYPRKIFYGGGLYLLVRPQGGRYWHYQYRYGGKRKTLSLGTYPDVPVDRAQARHRAARRLLAAGVDPSLRRRELRLMDGDCCAAAPEPPGIWRQAS